MRINSLIISFIAFPLLSFCADEADVEIIITIPRLSTVDGAGTGAIGSFFGVNHQSYSLTPETLEYNAISYPIFSIKEAFTMQENGYVITKDLRRNSFIPLPISLSTPILGEELSISITESGEKTFALLPKNKEQQKIEVKLFVVDFSSEDGPFPVVELLPSKEYTYEDVKNKSLFLFIPEKEGEKDQVAIHNYYLPLEVHYSSP